MEMSTASDVSGEEVVAIVAECTEAPNSHETNFDVGPAAVASNCSQGATESSIVEWRRVSSPTAMSDREKCDEKLTDDDDDDDEDEEEDEDAAMRRKILDEKEEVKALQLTIRDLRERLLERDDPEGSSDSYAADLEGAQTSPYSIRSPSSLSECGDSLLGDGSEAVACVPITRSPGNSSTTGSSRVSSIEAGAATEVAAGNRTARSDRVKRTGTMDFCNEEIIKSLKSNIVDVAKLHLKRYEAVETEMSDTRRDSELCRSKQSKLADKLRFLRKSLREVIGKYERMNRFERNMEANLKKGGVAVTRLNAEAMEENCDRDQDDGRDDDCDMEKSIRTATRNFDSMKSLKSITVDMARSCVTQCEQLEREMKAAKDYLEYCRVKEGKLKRQLSSIAKALNDLIETFERLKDSPTMAIRLNRAARSSKYDGSSSGPLSELNAC